jgi:hypothetical protein
MQPGDFMHLIYLAVFAAVGYFLRSEHLRMNKHIEEHDKSSGDQRETIARLDEKLTGTRGWLESIDERMKDGFQSLADKIDRLSERQ